MVGKKSFTRKLAEPLWCEAGVSFKKDMSFWEELKTSYRCGNILVWRWLPWILIVLLIIEILFSPAETVFVILQEESGLAGCNEMVCDSRDNFHCEGTTLVSDDYYCLDSSLCTSDHKHYENNLGCGYVCDDAECDQKDFFVCEGFTKHEDDYSCNARQECLPESIVDTNSPDCGWIDALAPNALGSSIEKYGKRVAAYEAFAVEEYSFIDMGYQEASETALPGEKFLFIDVEILNDTNYPIKAHLEDFKLVDAQGKQVQRQSYTASDSFPLIYAELQPQSKARGKIRYTVKANQFDFTLSYAFVDRNKAFTGSWSISLPQED